MQKYIIIVAGGKGLRFGSDLPKQFLLLHGKPVLMHTIEAFYKFDATIIIKLVLPIEHFDYWKSLCINHKFTIEHDIVAGGSERFYSVQNGVKSISGLGLVGIHDGVRPLVSNDTLARCYNEAALNGNAIPVIDIVDSIRYVSGTENSMVNRNQYKLVQTPQVFDNSILQEAFEQDYNAAFTDDASVVEKLGFAINLVQGNTENIKITSQLDLTMAQFLMNTN